MFPSREIRATNTDRQKRGFQYLDFFFRGQRKFEKMKKLTINNQDNPNPKNILRCYKPAR